MCPGAVQPHQRVQEAVVGGKVKVKVPPLWTGPSPFHGIGHHQDEEDHVEEGQGAQWVNGRGWVTAEERFLGSFDTGPPLLRRSGRHSPLLTDAAPGLPIPFPYPAWLNMSKYGSSF